MKLRDATKSDLPRIKELFEKQGFDYEFPDFEAMVAVKVIEDDDGRVVQVVAARETVELYFIGDKDWGAPGWRLSAFTVLHEGMRMALESLGLKDAHCMLPPEVEKSFGRRLMKQFGWSMSIWQPFWRKVSK